MTEIELVACAVAAVTGAVVAVHVPVEMLVGVAVLLVVGALTAGSWRRSAGAGHSGRWSATATIAPIVIVVVASSTLAARAEAGLAFPRVRGAAAGRAQVVTDPERRPGGWVVELRWRGVRWRAFVRTGTAPETGSTTDPATLSVGDDVAIRGRASPLIGPWEWRAARHLSGRLAITSVRRIDRGALWWRGADAVRSTIERGLVGFSADDRALFLGVLLGDDREQAALLRFRFRASGLSHITAVSGQNVAYLLVAASPLLTRLRLGVRWAVTLGLLAWFGLVTRLEPSVLRAVAMAGVALTAAWKGRYATGVRVLAVAITGLVLIDPLIVWSIGFRLSVVASGALIVGARPFASALPGPRWLTEAVAVPVVAQTATAPLLLAIGGSVPALGVVANVIGVPIAGALMVWGAVAAPVAGWLGGPLAVALGWPSRLMCTVLRSVAGWFATSSLPRWGAVGVAGSALVVLAMLALAHLDQDPDPSRAPGPSRPPRLSAARRVTPVLVAVGALACLVDAEVVLPPPLGPPTSVSDLGVTLRSRGGAAVLVLSAGATEDAALRALLRSRARRLDAVVVTGRGRTMSTLVWTLRQAAPVGVVAAADPSAIRNTVALAPGPMRVGPIVVTVERRPRRSRSPPGWSVRSG